LEDRFLNINFTVQGAVAKASTVLTVIPKCVVYKAPLVSLSATLTSNGLGVPNKTVSFTIRQFKTINVTYNAGSAVTDANGVATMTYNPSSLPVGDHDIYAEFSADAQYEGSNDSANLGINYMFIGFQPPLNADGTSVFANGRVIPVKIKIADYYGVSVPNATAEVYFKNISTSPVGTEQEAASVATPDVGNLMRYDAAAGQYIFNFDLALLVNGTYQVRVDLNDSKQCILEPYVATITIQKRK
jgi:hypothetical protein